jgi:hypothetical protein
MSVPLDFFRRSKVIGLWSCVLVCILCRGYECVEVCLHFPYVLRAWCLVKSSDNVTFWVEQNPERLQQCVAPNIDEGRRKKNFVTLPSLGIGYDLSCRSGETRHASPTQTLPLLKVAACQHGRIRKHCVKNEKGMFAETGWTDVQESCWAASCRNETSCFSLIGSMSLFLFRIIPKAMNSSESS